MHIPKKGLRALGIAESFAGRTHSTIAGVVMRKDLRIDGFVFGTVTVGGMDATDTVIGMVKELDRHDVNIIMLSGCVIAWFNIIDPVALFERTGIPIIGVTYEASEGLSADIQFHFPGDTKRLIAYEQLGDRTPVLLHTGYTLFLRSWGINMPDATRLCDDFTLEGKVPEPLRVARLCAHNVFRRQKGTNKEAL
jgi:endonuclease V-like protein UPF0215 family